MDEISLKSELLKQKEELIQCLQNELVEVRLQEAENAVIMVMLLSINYGSSILWFKIIYWTTFKVPA